MDIVLHSNSGPSPYGHDADEWMEVDATSTFVHAEALIDGQYRIVGDFWVDGPKDSEWAGATDWMPYEGDDDEGHLIDWNLTILAMNGNPFKVTSRRDIPPPVGGTLCFMQRYEFTAFAPPDGMSPEMQKILDTNNILVATVIPLGAIRDYDWQKYVPGSPALEAWRAIEQAVLAAGGDPDRARVYLFETEN